MRTVSHLTPNAAILEVGSNGSIPLLLSHVFGASNLSAADGLGGFFGHKDGRIVHHQEPDLDFALPITKVDLEHERWPFPDASRDFVLCFETLEHFREDPMFFMIEANRVLRPGGRLILTTPNSSSLRAIANVLNHWSPYLYSVYVRGNTWRGMAHVKEYAVRELRQLFEHAGFGIESHQTFSPYKDDVEDKLPALRESLRGFGLKDDFAGSTHFIVGAKRADPICRAYLPLYQGDEPWTGWPATPSV